MRGLELVGVLGREDQHSGQSVGAEVEFHQGFGLILCRADLVVLDGEDSAEGQGDDAVQLEEIALPAFLTADLPEGVASMMAAE